MSDGPRKRGDVIRTAPCSAPGCNGQIVQTFVRRAPCPLPGQPDYEIEVMNITCTVGGDAHLPYTKRQS